MKRLELLFFFFCLYLVPAQKLSPVFNSKNKEVNRLTELAREQMLDNDNNLQALKTADKAKQIAIEDGDALAIAKANATLGWIFLDGNNFDAAQDFAEKAFRNIKDKDYPEAEAMLHHQLAIILDKKSQPKEALKHYLESISYYEKSKNYLKLIQVYSEISRLHLVTGNLESYQKYNKLTESLLRAHPHAHMQLVFNNQQSYVLMGERKFEEAYNLNMQSVALAKKNNLPKMAAAAYYNAAGALFEMGKTTEANAMIDTGMGYAIKNKLDYHDFLLGKAQILSSKGQMADAEKLYTNAIDGFVKDKNAFMEMQTRRLLANFYRENRQDQKAAGQLFAYKKIEDSLGSVQQSIALKEVEYQYKDQEQEKLLESYKTSNALKNWLIGVSTLLALGALYLFFNLRRNSALRQTLFEKKEKLLESEKQNAINEKELAKKEEEKALLNEKLLLEEQKTLRLEKESTDRELASITLYVQEKNRMIEHLQSQMDELLHKSSAENRDKLLDISRNLKQNINFEKDWDKIKLHFEKVHPDFFRKLSENYPNLTPNELKQCAYIKINMSNKETANLLGVDHNSVKMSRYRIKKKMNLEPEVDLTSHIQNL